jgi:hypothetical protein
LRTLKCDFLVSQRLDCFHEWVNLWRRYFEARKRAAVEAEDYDAAKVIKSEIDKLRAAGGVTVGLHNIANPLDPWRERVALVYPS